MMLNTPTTSPGPPTNSTDTAVSRNKTTWRPQAFHAEGRFGGAGTVTQYGGAGSRKVGRGEPSLLAQVLEVLAGLEADRAAGGNPHLLASPWVTADSALAGLHLEDPEAAELDPLSTHHGFLHRLEHGLDRDFSLDLRDVGGPADLVDDVHLDHLGMDLLVSQSYYRSSPNLLSTRPRSAR